MFNTVIGLAVFFVLALAGWAIAELKGKTCNYKQNQNEIDEDTRLADQLHKNGYTEMDINDVIKNISTKGFKAK